ncbi:phosphonate ABC transporter, permease protein PhnE [Elioraea sp.]|uniref:phosphonate ABC transporter, permease protein PhnE n=1 Tax=Elioraea sp. TaxID=2185103 RepID=UPI0025BE8876|nr:phosphonate ABC transporter, permease protein PhnE [Elioraea sp.]
MTVAAAQADAAEVFSRRFAAHRSQRRAASAGYAALFLVAVIVSSIVGEVDLARLAAGLPNIAAYIGRTLPVLRLDTLWADIGEWLWAIDIWLVMLGDTVLMALVGTVFGGAIAALLCFEASENCGASPLARQAARRAFDVLRSVPELVFALVFVFAFGPGPFAGVLAILLHSAGALGKLFAEANENAEAGPYQAVLAAGGTRLHAIRFGIVPQILPNHLSYLLLRFEINVRAASVLGVVGAGGIGEELYLVVRQFIYSDISAIVLLILLAVAIVDIGCEKLRHALIAPAGAAR